MTARSTPHRAARILVALVLAAAVSLVSPAISAQAASKAPRSIPAVVGWTAVGAVTALHSHGFKYTFKAPKGHHVKNAAHWTVTGQSPKGHSRAKPGTTVTLKVVKTSVYLSQGARSFYAKDYGTFTPVGSGSSGTSTMLLPKGVRALLLRVSYSGAGRFQVTELDKNGAPTSRVPINTTGSYSGLVAIGLTPSKAPTAQIRISGTGHWNILMLPIAQAPIISTPIRDTGDHVYLYSGPSAIWTVSSPGPTKFVLGQTSSSSFPNLAVDESGNWAGKIALEPGPSVIQISSNGSWAIS